MDWEKVGAQECGCEDDKKDQALIVVVPESLCQTDRDGRVDVVIVIKHVVRLEADARGKLLRPR